MEISIYHTISDLISNSFSNNLVWLTSLWRPCWRFEQNNYTCRIWSRLSNPRGKIKTWHLLFAGFIILSLNDHDLRYTENNELRWLPKWLVPLHRLWGLRAHLTCSSYTMAEAIVNSLLNCTKLPVALAINKPQFQGVEWYESRTLSHIRA
jgi:hypothetical protein